MLDFIAADEATGSPCNYTVATETRVIKML